MWLSEYTAIKTTSSSETLSTQRCNPQDQHGNFYRRENLKSDIDFFPESFELRQSFDGFIT